MKYLIGIDGGGTKTAFILCDEVGKEIMSLTAPGTSYLQYGMNMVIDTLESNINKCISLAKINRKDIIGICAALPCIGEYEESDKEFIQRLKSRLREFNLEVINDAIVGWAGSLAGKAGINIVAGTGSIAYGEDNKGQNARCGGWSWKFGDEGSCYWAGLKTMQLFSKEADGRAPKGALYDIFSKKLNLKNDMQFIEIIEKDYCPYREKVASLQIDLCSAAQSGDKEAVNIYTQAAIELAGIVKAIAKRLSFKTPVCVSYSGGMFKAGDLVLKPFIKELPKTQFTLCTPVFTPVQGAVIMAFRLFLGKNEGLAIQTMQTKK